jgi:pilus assembly protein CpaF
MEGEVTQMQEIYKFVREGIDQDGSIIGSFRATGIRPRFLEQLKAMGINIPATHFDSQYPL